jgi:hypothetical protein
MADGIGSWGDATFSNVTSLLSKSPAWKKYFPQSSTDWKPTAGTFGSALGNDPIAGYKLAADNAVNFPGMFTPGEATKESTQLTPYTPTGVSVPGNIYDSLNALQQQNFENSQRLMDRNAGMAQGYANQLLSNTKDLRNLDYQLGLSSKLAQQNMPAGLAAISSTYQAMKDNALGAEANMLGAISDASYKAALVNRIPRSGLA